MDTETKTKILLVDDDPPVLTTLRDIFGTDYDVLAAPDGAAAIALTEQHPDIATVVMDIKMAGIDGITAARRIREVLSDVPIIFHTGYPGEYKEDEIDDQEKPFDYIQKGKSIPQLMRSVRNAVQAYDLKQDNCALSSIAESNYEMHGKSSAMQEVFRTIYRLSNSDNKVMILGESGTGKELVARAIHNCSRRKDQKLAILNCNHKSPNIIEAELFGNTKGAYTSSVENRIGLFEYADGGTLFLDEIGDLDITTQGKMLRVIETGEFTKLGTPETRRTDVRVICATHRNLEQLVENGTFRRDLYYRLKGIKVVLPPLKDRKEDIPLLVEKFTAAYIAEKKLAPKIFDSSALSILIEFDWPGNVRQLLDTVESLITLTDSDIVFGEEVQKYLQVPPPPEDFEERKLSARLRALERTLIIGALAEVRYNVSRAAQVLGIDRSNLQKKIKSHHIDVSVLKD